MQPGAVAVAVWMYVLTLLCVPSRLGVTAVCISYTRHVCGRPGHETLLCCACAHDQRCVTRGV
jgi:hypothetical protein